MVRGGRYIDDDVLILRDTEIPRCARNDMTGWLRAPFPLSFGHFPRTAGATLPPFPGHTPLTSLRSFAPLSLCERGGRPRGSPLRVSGEVDH